ncbi:MAG: phosphate ABC transporter permease subunit PstC [Anaerorhabdus sp.]
MRNLNQKRKDKLFKGSVFGMSILSSSFIILLILFIFIKGISPFLNGYEYGQINFLDFLFGMTYRQDQGIYGVGFIIINTMISAGLALLLSFPISVLTSLFIVKIAPNSIKSVMRTVVELLASIPSIVYGVFASGVIASLVQDLGAFMGVSTAGGSSLLAVILLLAIMIFPTITSLSMSSIEAVDKNLELASLALGATQTQTNFKVVLTSAKSGIFAGAILGVGRAFGEATAVAMVAGNKMFGPTSSFFDITRTLTTTMLAGLKETTGLDYDIRFSIGLVLMAVIFISNGTLNAIKRKVGN